MAADARDGGEIPIVGPRPPNGSFYAEHVPWLWRERFRIGRRKYAAGGSRQ